MKKGDIFGELGLVQNENRSATIITNEICEFAILDREDFLFPIKSEINKAIKKKIVFLQKIFELDISYNSQFFKLVPYFEKKKIKKENFIYKENDFFEKIIFVIKGNLILQKKNCKVLSEFLTKDKEIKKNFGKLFFDRSKNLRKINRDIIIYGKNKIIGIKNFKEKLKKNFFSLKAKTDVKYYFITKANFEKCIKDFYICKLFYKNKMEIEYNILNVF